MGAQPLIKAAKRLEAALKKGDAAVGPLVDEFQSELNETIAYLRAR